jgi:hypothetical protein
VELKNYIPEFARSLSRRALDSAGIRRVSRPDFDPYDLAASRARAQELFERLEREQPLGTIARSRLLLEIIGNTYPTPVLENAYFVNLELAFRGRKKMASCGKLVIGLGSGRSGSTTLTALLASVAGACCTHENPPLIYWKPSQAQIEFHIRRFRFLSDYYSLVSDVSHWWLNPLETVFAHFPDCKAIGLIRDPTDCAKSFMRIKGYGFGSINHWACPGSGSWFANHWDPTYPSYDVPSASANQLDHVKLGMITRYVREYNDELAAITQRLPTRVLLQRTEELGGLAARERISQFLGVECRKIEIKLNVRNRSDGERVDFRL